MDGAINKLLCSLVQVSVGRPSRIRVQNVNGASKVLIRVGRVISVSCSTESWRFMYLAKAVGYGGHDQWLGGEMSIGLYGSGK